MDHGYDDDDEDYPPPMAAGPSSLLAHLMGGAGMGMGRFARAPPPNAYDEYFKAYSVAVMGGNERPELSYGGKIIMPPSALAKLSALDIPGPWTFHLRNPRNPTVQQTHAGVLEFIADEGVIHLPGWMMRNLGITEGDPIRVTGAKLPKGKMIKIQAQSTDFLEVSDPKAVLESALRFYSCLSKGDIIEVSYNSIVFEFLIMEVTPDGPGISVIDTDLEVDFEAPKGYVEPPRAAPIPIPTMADKLKIDLGGTTPSSVGSTRPNSRASFSNHSGEMTPLESFTGVGQSLSGRKVKGKGLAKKIEEVDPNSKINRNDGPRIITPETLSDGDRRVPAALVLPLGKFFFGFRYVPFDPSKAPKKPMEAEPAQPFSGEGNTLRKPSKAPTKPTNGTNGHAASEDDPSSDPWSKLGNGNTLRTAKSASQSQSMVTPAKSKEPSKQEVIDATMLDEDDFVFGDPDDDVIEIDSD